VVKKERGWEGERKIGDPGRRNGAATMRFRMLSVPVYLPHMRYSHPRRHRRAILRPTVTTGVRPYVKAGVRSSLAIVVRLDLLAFRSLFNFVSLRLFDRSSSTTAISIRTKESCRSHRRRVSNRVTSRSSPTVWLNIHQFRVWTYLSELRYETCFKCEKFYRIIYG